MNTLSDGDLLELLRSDGVTLVEVKGTGEVFVQKGTVTLNVSVPLQQLVRLEVDGILEMTLETDTVARYTARVNTGVQYA